MNNFIIFNFLTMNTDSEGPRWGKWLILSVSAIFTLYSLYIFVLVIYGEDVQAKVTSYRQEYGERDETIRNQYTYLYAYEFSVDGKTYTGTGQLISDSIFLKNSQNQFMQVKYLECCPYLNTYFRGTKTLLNGGISLLIGMLLFYFTRRM